MQTIDKIKEIYGDDTMTIKIDDEKYIVININPYASEYDDKTVNELSIFITDKNGNADQDIAMIRSTTDKKIETLLWLDENDEDYTTKKSVSLKKD